MPGQPEYRVDDTVPRMNSAGRPAGHFSSLIAWFPQPASRNMRQQRFPLRPERTAGNGRNGHRSRHRAARSDRAVSHARRAGPAGAGLGELVRRANRQTTDLVFLDLQGRLARKLLELAEAPGGPSTTILDQSRFTQTELANMVGGARQTVNLALRSLEKRGLIRMSEGKLEILDFDQLKRRVET